MLELPERILQELQAAGKSGELRSNLLAQQLRTDHQKIVGAVKSLESLDNVICTRLETLKRWELTGESSKCSFETVSHLMSEQPCPE